MSNEQRNIEINVDVANAISALNRMGRALDTIELTYGASDNALQRYQNKLDQMPAVLAKVTAALQSQKVQSKSQQEQIKSLTNTITQYQQKLRDVRDANDALRTSQSNASQAILKFGASAKVNGQQLDKLEAQLTSINRFKFNNLQLPKTLFTNQGGGINQLAGLNVNSLQNLPKEQLASLSRAFELQQSSLQSEVSKALQSKLQGGQSVATGAFANSLRYQLYSVAATLGIVGAAVDATSVAFFNAGIQWDKDFANVVRTSQVTGANVEKLKDQFLALQSIVPVSASDLATIGTLGAQMGVSANNLANFTKVTAEFSATSNVSVDDSATALARLNALLPDVKGNYSKLASAILKTGVNAVATEGQIVAGTTQIASIGRIAGLSTPQIIALSSAMSSVGFTPELQRSVITSSFSKILAATSSVTATTQKFGAVLGITGQQFKTAWGKDAIGTYENLLKTIAGRGDAVSVLQNLGLASQRLTPNLLKLGQNTAILDKALKDTQEGWDQNTELTRQYGIISDTVSAKIQVLGQSWDAFIVTLNESNGGPIGGIIDFITDLVHGLTNLAKNPGLQALVTIGAVIGGGIGIAAVATAGISLLTAGYIGLANASIGLEESLIIEKARIAADTAAKVVNAEATAAMSGAEDVSTVSIVANEAALDTSTVSATANALAMDGVGAGLIGLNTKLLTNIPLFLKWSGVVAGAAVGAAAAYLELEALPDQINEINKAIAGVNGTQPTIKFDTIGIGKSLDQAKEIGDRLAAQKKQDPNFNTGIFHSNLVENLPKYDSIGDEFKQNQNIKTQASDLSKTILGLSTYQAKLEAVNQVSKAWGVSQGTVLKLLPDVANALDTNAASQAKAQEQTEALANASDLWAASLSTNIAGVIVQTGDLDALGTALSAGAKSFFDFGTELTNALAKADKTDPTKGGGFKKFTTELSKQVTDYGKFQTSLGQLVQKGGVQLATLFAQQGPDSMAELTDALKMSPDQLAQVESQMRQAAFYASTAFSDSFKESNAALAQVWAQTGSTDAVSAFSDAWQKALESGNQIDIATLAALAGKYGIKLDVSMFPTLSKPDLANALADAQAAANATKITIPAQLSFAKVTPGVSAPAAGPTTDYEVNEAGHTILLKVAPDTTEGTKVLDAWRANEYNVPVKFAADVDTGPALTKLAGLRSELLRMQALSFITVHVKTPAGQLFGNAKGGLLDRFGQGHPVPGYANGGMPGMYQGPGSGTSDSMLARVSNGEYINTAATVRYYSPEFFDAIARHQVPRYNSGGQVGVSGPGGSGATMNVTVVQNYPTTKDPIKTLKEDAENAVAGLW